ncbi:E3 ubiquitin-protein ligase TRIP12-like [Contarinia nasturtii]|uniref:E3 ubiquitin-protein ligase TRIP12-like n=1 Tax=Contarinia nasturtii TaxID=265458 RepID=UPI0012D48EE5|nr:E3 ubiquitin-protein ligase TRIP12-like [Contarinia nasturtii]
MSQTDEQAVNVRRYVHAQFGLFPMPISHSAKQIQISRIKSKFKFLGKFMADLIMDSRMLLYEDSSLGLGDLSSVAPEVQVSLKRLQNIIESLHYDGCPIADLGLNFTLPGHATIELRRRCTNTI